MKRFVPFPFYKWLMRTIFSSGREFSDLPHRRWITEEMFPYFAAGNPGSVVFVGCAPYTWHYERLLRDRGTDYITIDPAPNTRVWGSSHHYVGFVQDLYKLLPAHSVDVVIMIGIYGFGIANDQQLHEALGSIHKLLKPGGVFVFSWNNDISTDPQYHPDLIRQFQHVELGALPKRKEFKTLVLDFYRALPADQHSNAKE